MKFMDVNAGFFLMHRSNPITLFKIDAEGAEIGILKGATSLFRSGAVHRVVTELSPQWWKRLAVTVDDGVDTIEAAAEAGNFTLFVFPNRGEMLGAGLVPPTDAVSLAGVKGLREINSISKFVSFL